MNSFKFAPTAIGLNELRPHALQGLLLRHLAAGGCSSAASSPIPLVDHHSTGRSELVAWPGTVAVSLPIPRVFLSPGRRMLPELPDSLIELGKAFPFSLT